MSASLPSIPRGNGQHPIRLVTLAANRLDASARFYEQCFGWKPQRLSPELAVAMPAGGPVVALRAGVPEGFPGVVPFIAVPDVAVALQGAVAAGGTVERDPWTLPLVGTLARFRDRSGTLYGLTDAPAMGRVAHVPIPFGDAPKPAPGTVCSLEMYTHDGEQAAAFFGARFGWGTAPTMPRFVGFDPGAGIGGVFQSHTPGLPAVAYLYVTDVKRTLASVVEAGGKALGEPAAMPGMATFGYFIDASDTTMGLIGG